MRIKVAFLLFLSCLFINLAQAQPEDSSLSGQESLLYVFKTLGIESNLGEVEQLSGYDSNKISTIYDLSRAAESKRLYSMVGKFSSEELSRMKVPIIVSLFDGSFEVLDGFENNKIRVVRYDREPIWETSKKFDDDYAGMALLVSRDESLFPKINRKGPDIRFDEYVHDLGLVKNEGRGEKILTHIFKFRNEGNENLEIIRVRASCGCTATVLSDKNIPPGAEGEIKVNFNIKGRIGNQNTNVYVFSNDPVTPVVKLQVRVIIQDNELSVYPTAINFGDTKKSAITPQKLYVTTHVENEDFSIIKIESSSKYILTDLSANKTENLGKGFQINVSISPDMPFGKFNEKLVIYTSDKKQPKIEVPVIGNIEGDIELQPSEFLFGLAGEIKESKVTLFTEREKPFEIEKIENVPDVISIEKVTLVKGRKYELIARLKDNAPLNDIKGTITVYTDNPEQKRINIPLSCLLNKKLPN